MGGGSVYFHLSRVLCSSLPLYLGFEVWGSSHPHVQQEAQFTSSIWSGVCASLGILASTTTSFHPQSNGMIKQFHHSLKSALLSGLASSDCFFHLPLVLLRFRTVPKDEIGLSVS